MSDRIHACFISYRHPASKGGREEKLIRHVVKAIKEHIEIYTHEHKVYFDESRMVPGYNYDDRLAEAICRSACMVIVYWPSYLESDYCRKEIVTMLKIEKRRQKHLKEALHGCRLFIPVVLRGNFEDLPEDITKNTHKLDYKAQATRSDYNIGDDEEVSAQLFEIAEYVTDLCVKMKGAEDALFRKCKNFRFPKSAPGSIRTKISSTPQQPFPGR